MVYVICAAKMESNIFSAILFMTKITTTKSSRNLTTRIGAEPLRDIFLRKTGNQYLYFPGPLDEQSNTKWRSPHDLVFGPKKDETEHMLQTKYAQLTHCKFLCPHRSWRSEATRRNREITGFDHRNFVERSSDLSRTRTR